MNDLHLEELIKLYQEMADLTNPECRACLVPLSCCDSMHCQMTKEWAKDVWNVDLIPTSHPKLLFMGPTGCIVPPHLRPTCTLHTCSVNSLGFKKGDPEWTKKYFALREKIELLELEKFIEDKGVETGSNNP